MQCQRVLAAGMHQGIRKNMGRAQIQDQSCGHSTAVISG